MGSHINKDGLFQSDKYPTCPPDKVPLSVRDRKAQPLLWAYAMGHSEDMEFGSDLRSRLRAVGFTPNCHACSIEAEIGNEENPHPVPARFHSCVRLPGLREPPCAHCECPEAHL